MTIFGFNTDVKHGDTVYHVQSEARHNDLLLQTLVFVKGQCLGKHTVSYAQKVSQPGFSSEAMHELLKAQHKVVIDAIQQGRAQELVVDAGVQDVGGSGLSLRWINTTVDFSGASISMNFEVMDLGHAISGAQVVCRACSPPGSHALAHATTDTQGRAVVQLPVNEEVQREAAVMVEAIHGEKSATRKFRFKK